VHPPGVQLDEEQHIQPSQPDGVDGGQQDKQLDGAAECQVGDSPRRLPACCRSSASWSTRASSTTPHPYTSAPCHPQGTPGTDYPDTVRSREPCGVNRHLDNRSQ
jgi:hypothetical protein